MPPTKKSDKKLRIIFMGTPEFALPSFEALAKTEELIAVVTQPDRPKGRKGALSPPPIKMAAATMDLPVFQPERLRKSPELIEALRQLAPDLIIVVAFGQILPADVLDIPKQGCINVHSSLLPKYRGAGPIQWAIIRGERETGVTTMQMDAGMDTGPILLKKAVPIAPHETAESLTLRLADVGAELLIETLQRLKEGSLKALPQNDAEASAAPLLKKEAGKVSWEEDAEVIYNRWRGLFPWPGLTTYYGNTRWKIISVKPGTGESPSGVPGEILDLSKQGLEVATGKGSLVIDCLQVDGKRKMTPREYAAGHPITIGAVLRIKA